MIGFDHNAGTPLHPAVSEAWAQLLREADLGNPSSIHRQGQRAREVLEQARRAVAHALGVPALGVTFTSGGTEADALAIEGSAAARERAGRPAGVLTSAIEHPAVLGAVARVQARGHRVVRVPLDDRGRFAPGEVAAIVADAPDLGIVSLAAANHELGNRYDVAAIVAAVRSVRDDVTIHVDAVQAFGKVPVDLAAWGADLVAVSAHKIGGPAGIGALVHDPQARLEPLWQGGAQERGRRPGTESLWLAHAFGVAATRAEAEREVTAARWAELRPRLRAGIEALDGRIHGDLEATTGNTLNAGFDGCDGQLLVMALDLAGFATSTGAACSAGTSEPSAVLRALGQSPARARQALRLSMGRTTTAADVDGLLAALAPAVARVRTHAGELAS